MVTCAHTGDCTFQGTGQGAGATCEALATQSGWCACSGAEKPIALPTSGRVPPGLLAHKTRDDTVSVYCTCALAARLRPLGGTATLLLFTDAGAGHAIAPGFATQAWGLLAGISL